MFLGRNRESRSREAAGRRNGQVKRKRKSQLCNDHHRFENGARFEWLLRFGRLVPDGRQSASRLVK